MIFILNLFLFYNFNLINLRVIQVVLWSNLLTVQKGKQFNMELQVSSKRNGCSSKQMKDVNLEDSLHSLKCQSSPIGYNEKLTLSTIKVMMVLYLMIVS